MKGALLITLSFVPSLASPNPSPPQQYVVLSAELGIEHDSNSARTLSGDPSALPFVQTGPRRPDQLMRGAFELGARLETSDRRHSVSVGALAGTKRFFEERSEDVVGLTLNLGSQHRLGTWTLQPRGQFQLGHVREGSRDFQRWSGGLACLLNLDWASLSAASDIQTFRFLPDPRLSFLSPQLLGTARFSIRPEFDLMVVTGVRWRWYEGNALVEGTDADGNVGVTFCDGSDIFAECSSERRFDTEALLGTTLLLRAGVHGEISYLFRPQRSSSSLDNLDRHQFEAAASIQLPLSLLLSARGTLLISSATSSSEQLIVRDDSENQTGLQIQLERAIARNLALQIRYGLFASQFGESIVDYERHTFYSGVRLF